VANVDFKTGYKSIKNSLYVCVNFAILCFPGFAACNILSEFSAAKHALQVIVEKIYCEQDFARNGLAVSCMCRGDGAVEPPRFLLDGAATSTLEDNRRYPSNVGFVHTRQKVLEFIQKKFGIENLDIDNLCPNNGVSDSFAKVVALLIEKDDAVISFVPTFGLYSNTIDNYGGQVIPLDVLGKKGALPSIEELEQCILKANENLKRQTEITGKVLSGKSEGIHRPRVKLLTLINPSNPLGTVISDTEANREYFKRIYQLAVKYNFMIFNDLVYWGTEHDPNVRAMPFLTAVPEAIDRVVMAFGPSKTVGGARMRSGMLVGPKWFIKEAQKVVLNINSGISAFNQYVMAAAFDMNFENEREAFLRKNANEYALRRDVCIVGILGAQAVLDGARYGINQNRMEEVKLFVRLVAYARLLIKEYEVQGVATPIQKALNVYEKTSLQIKNSLEKETWFTALNAKIKDEVLHEKIYAVMNEEHFSDELYLIAYVFYRELKNKTNFIIPQEIVHFVDSVYLSDKLHSLEIPERYKKQVEDYVNDFLNGAQYLKVYSVPQATFFLAIDASEMIGKYAPLDIGKTATERAQKIKHGEKIPQGNDIIKISPDTINPSPIASSYEISLLFSWLGGQNYLSGELFSVAPERGLLRMTYAEPPITFMDAIDSMRYVAEYVKASPDARLWIDGVSLNRKKF
jgi:aspartate/methionine/tyrosine aminotransferase